MTSSSPTTTDSISRRGRINVVVAYEDYHAGKRAQFTCQQMISLAHGDGILSTDLWKFDMLKLGSMRTTAIEDAARADLVVLAPHDGLELAPFAMDWVRLILEQPTQPKALLVLLESTPAEAPVTSPVQEQLSEFETKIQLRCLRPTYDGEWWEPGYDTFELAQIARKVFSTPPDPVSAAELMPVLAPAAPANSLCASV